MHTCDMSNDEHNTGLADRLHCLQKQGINWALAGRNQKKLDSVKDELRKIDPSVKVSPFSTLAVADTSHAF